MFAATARIVLRRLRPMTVLRGKRRKRADGRSRIEESMRAAAPSTGWSSGTWS